MSHRLVALATLASLAFAGCSSQVGGANGVELASNQTLNLAIAADVQTLDPSTISQPGVEVNIARNLFGGLYRYEDDLRIVPDLADAMPQVSQDGRTWTFHLRRNARFWNGDPVHASDVVFSWSRAAARLNDDATVFAGVVGFEALQAGRSDHLEGLSAADDGTVVARLAEPAGWWLAELPLWPAFVLDERIVRRFGDDVWWRTPEGLVGTGPFKLTAGTTGTLDFVPVAGWWQGSTGTLKHVHVEVVADAGEQVRMFEAGRLDVVGNDALNTATFLPASVAKRYLGDRKLQLEVHSRPWLKSEFITFNLSSGPLSGTTGLPARRALSRAIDRSRFVREICDDINCTPASGGPIVRGLRGYLGDRADPNAAFDPEAARTALHAWDPDGSRARQLALLCDPDSRAKAMEIARQWKENLGIDVPVQVQLPPAVGEARRRGNFVMTVSGWLADYDSPYDWYNNSFGIGTWYSNASFTAFLGQAAPRPPSDAQPYYDRASRILIDDVVLAALDYLQWSYLVASHVQGAGGNALYDYFWRSIRKVA